MKSQFKTLVLLAAFSLTLFLMACGGADSKEDVKKVNQEIEQLEQEANSIDKEAEQIQREIDSLNNSL